MIHNLLDVFVLGCLLCVIRLRVTSSEKDVS